VQVGTGAAVQIQSTGWQDCVVWNPHLTMAACYDHFVCVENAQFNTPIELAAGKDWSATANFDVVDLVK
jgi:glucose-6-phosphate 1-epimerase